MGQQTKPLIRSTTVLGVIRNGKAALGSDGQMTLGNTVLKHSTRKTRRLYQGRIITGFAGATADAVTLLDRFEEKLDAYSGRLERAAVELARDWRTDKYLRRLEAMLAVVSSDKALIISGTGDVIEPEDGIVAIGSGSMYALAAARSLMKHTDLAAKEIVAESLKIAAEICIYTNDHINHRRTLSLGRAAHEICKPFFNEQEVIISNDHSQRHGSCRPDGREKRYRRA